MKRLSGASFAGRDNDTPESDRAQRLLIGKLRRFGSGLNTAATGDDAFRQPFEQSGQIGTNLVAVIRGRELPDEYVIVGAHYDHLDSRSTPSGSCSIRNAPGGVICPGATDNAAGVGAVLGIGRALGKLSQPPRRSVVLALWDAEEDGLLGSLYYVQHPLVPLAKTVAYVNFDIQGANLLPSLRRVSFSVGAETGGSALGAFVSNAVAAEGLDTRPVSFIFGQLRSDYANFVRLGQRTDRLLLGLDGRLLPHHRRHLRRRRHAQARRPDAHRVPHHRRPRRHACTASVPRREPGGRDVPGRAVAESRLLHGAGRPGALLPGRSGDRTAAPERRRRRRRRGSGCVRLRTGGRAAERRAAGDQRPHPSALPALLSATRP